MAQSNLNENVYVCGLCIYERHASAPGTKRCAPSTVHPSLTSSHRAHKIMTVWSVLPISECQRPKGTS